MDSWVAESGATLSFDTVGTTLGSSSLKIVTSGGWHAVISRDVTSFISLLAQSGSTISLDITTRNDDNSIPNWWLQNQIILNSDATGWVGLSGAPGTAVGWSPTTTSEIYNIAPATAASLATATWAQLLLINNTGDPGAALYVDKIAINVVPEPAAASLIGLGAASLLISRRRQA